MATGNPILVCVANGTSRILELTESGLIQLGTLSVSAGSYGTASPADIFFLPDRVLINHRGSSTSVYLKLVDYFGNQISSASRYLGSSVGQILFIRTHNIVLVQTSLHQGRIFHINDDTIEDVKVTDFGAPSAVSVRANAVTPDGDVIVAISSDAFYYYTSGELDEDGYPTYSYAGQVVIPDGDNFFNRAIASDDGRFFIFWRDDNVAGRAVVLSRDGNTVSFLSEISEGNHNLGTITDITMSDDSLLIAIGYENGSNYTTRVLRRVGPYFSDLFQLTGMGARLAFSASGRVLVDPVLGVAYEIDGSSYTDITASIGISPFTGNYLRTKFSDQILGQGSVAYLYDGALLDVLSEHVDLANLKMALLDETATFDPTDGELDIVTANGSKEVFGGEWAQGGVLLENVRFAGSGSTVTVTADEIRKLIFGSSLTFRHAVIYEDSGVRRPLTFIDFHEPIELPFNQMAVFNFDDSGFISLGF